METQEEVKERKDGGENECETWFIALREEDRLSMSEDRKLGRTFQFKRQEETGRMTKQQNENFQNIYASHNIIRKTKQRRMRWTEKTEHVGKMRNLHAISFGKIKLQKRIGRPGGRWYGSIQIKRNLKK